MGVLRAGFNGTVGQPSAQVIDGSLKFAGGTSGSSNQYLEHTFSSEGNRRTFTLSFWLKRSDVEAYPGIFFCGSSSVDPNNLHMYFNGDTLLLYSLKNNSNVRSYNTSRQFRDTSGWYHIVVAVDSTISSPALDRFKVYVNGDRVTEFASGNHNAVDENTNFTVNQSGKKLEIGLLRNSAGALSYTYNGYMSQWYFIDGQALGPEYFGFTDSLTNTWRPKKLSNLSGPNDGRTWSSDVTFSPGVLNADRGADKAFNGTTSDNASTTSNNPALLTASFSTNITGVTSLRIYSGSNSSDAYINGASGSTVSITANSWTDLTSLASGAGGTISSISVVTAGDNAQLAAVEVNGTMLIDGDKTNFGSNGFHLPMDGNSPIGQDKSGRGNDYTPVNFGGSVEPEKATGALPILNTTQGGSQAGVGVRTDTSATSINSGQTWSSGSTVTGGTLNNAGQGFDGSISSSGYAELAATDTSTTANVTFTASIPNVTKVEVFVHSASSSGDTRGTCLDTDGVTHTSATLTSASQSFHTIYEGPPITLANVGWGINQNGQTGTSSDGFRAFRVNGYILKDSTSSGEGLVLALPLVGNKEDVSNQINGGSTAKVVAANGDAAASSETSNLYAASFKLDGSGDYITVTDSTELEPGTGDFCYEGWFRGANFTGAAYILFDSTQGTGVYFYTTNKRLYLYLGSSQVASTDCIQNDKWHHIAFVRDGGTGKIFCDGVLVGSGSKTDSVAGGNLVIGASTGGGNPLNGYVQDVRVYNGTPKYFGTTVGTQYFVPPSRSPDILPDTPTSVGGGSKLTKITDGAVSFDGNDYLSISQSDDFNLLDDGTFTIEFFLYARTLNGSYADYFGVFDGGSTGLLIYEIGSNLDVYINGGQRCTTTHPGTNKWHHIAVTRDGTTLRLFVDGISKSTSTASLGSDYSGALHIGGDPSRNDLDGYISNVRVIKGTALYTSNFTPPTAPLTDVTNTKLLCCQSNTSAGVAAVSPQISGLNSGAVWSDYLTTTQGANSRDFYTGYNYPATNLFDGNTSSIVYGGWIDDSDDASDLIFSPPSGITVSSKLEVYVGYYSLIKVNGSNYNTGGHNTAQAWVTVSDGSNFTGTLNELILENTTNANVVRAAAIRIDDSTILLDPVSAKGNAVATNFNPFNTDINTVRGQETGYPTWNPLRVSGQTLSNNNMTTTGTGSSNVLGSMFTPTSGKFYWEVTAGSNYTMTGIQRENNYDMSYPGSSAGQIAL